MLQFQLDRGVRLGELQPSGLHQGEGGRQGGVAGQRDLLGRGEVAHGEIGNARAPDKGRLRQVHLAGDGQHGRLVQVVGIQQHRAGVAAQGAVGEGIDLQEGVGRHRSLLSCSSDLSRHYEILACMARRMGPSTARGSSIGVERVCQLDLPGAGDALQIRDCSRPARFRPDRIATIYGSKLQPAQLASQRQAVLALKAPHGGSNLHQQIAKSLCLVVLQRRLGGRPGGGMDRGRPAPAGIAVSEPGANRPR